MDPIFKEPEKGKLGIIETSVTKRRTTQRNTRKQRRPQVNGEGNLKPLLLFFFITGVLELRIF